MMRLAMGLISGAVTCCFIFGAAAADVERPSFDNLFQRVECTVWASDRLQETWDRHQERVRRTGGRLWDKKAQELVATSSALDNYLARHVFVWMDPDTYRAVVATYWPEGAVDTADRSQRCEGYMNRHFLRYVRNPDSGYSNWQR